MDDARDLYRTGLCASLKTELTRYEKLCEENKDLRAIAASRRRVVKYTRMLEQLYPYQAAA